MKYNNCEVMSMRHQQPIAFTAIRSEMPAAQISEETMAPTPVSTQPISRTYQYRKVMKPMLERKRRARINRCLDELKDLMVTAMEAEGGNVQKLEKADILEQTVKYLHKLRREQRLASNPVTETDRFRAGFTHCANEVSRCLATTPGVDVELGTKLMTHLGYRLNEMNKKSPLRVQIASSNAYTPPGTPSPQEVHYTAVSSSDNCPRDYAMPLTPVSSTSSYTRFAPSPSNNQPMDCSFSTGGLLKVAIPVHSNGSEPVWRPW